MAGQKIPVSVLVVIHQPNGKVLLIERSDHGGFWQSVTGSLDSRDELPLQAAQRELLEETGLTAAASAWDDWQVQQRYEIYPHWRHRYPEGTTHNTEHVFSVCVPEDSIIRLSPREHRAHLWLDWSEAAERCFSWTNVLAIRQLALRKGYLRADMPRQLTVASYNIHKGLMTRQLGLGSRLVIHELAQAVRSLEADLISLQEVQGRHDRHARRHAHWPDRPQHELLCEVGYQAVYSPSAHYLHGHHGNALLSRHPVVFHETRDFSDHVLEKRAVLHAVVAWNGRSLHVFVVHFGLLAAGRRRQLDALIRWIQDCTLPTDPVLVAGDFNDWQLRLGEPLRREAGLQEVLPMGRSRPSNTYPSLLPLLPMDRIFQRGFEPEACHRAPAGARWSRLSDHLPVVARLKPLENWGCGPA